MSSSMPCNSRLSGSTRRVDTHLRAALVTVFVYVCTGGANAQTPATPAAPALTLSEAMERAVAANPAIAAARLQRPIDVAGIDVAGERPNPDVLYEAEKETPRQAIGGTLPIELGGKRSRRLDVAKATVAVSDAELARVIAGVRRDVRRAYFDAVAAQMRAQISDDLRALAQRARDAANARVVAGDVPDPT